LLGVRRYFATIPPTKKEAPATMATAMIDIATGSATNHEGTRLVCTATTPMKAPTKPR
jgi:hypothetical protein